MFPWAFVQHPQMFASIAQDIWEKMKDLTPMRKPAYHMTHDGKKGDGRAGQGGGQT